MRERLHLYNGDVPATIESLLENPPPHNVPENVINDSQREYYLQCMGPRMKKDTPLCTTDTPLKTDVLDDRVQNGDCAFYCLAQMLFFIYTFVNYPSNISSARVAEDIAFMMRSEVFRYIEDHWSDWWERMKLQHYDSIPDWEKREHGDVDWGNTPDATRPVWVGKRDEFYGTEVEMSAFADMLWEEDKISLLIRVWREEDGKHLKLASLHHPDADPETCIVADVVHTGQTDTNEAHWQLMNSGSFWVEDTEGTHEKKKKKRKKGDEDDDPDYIPCKKKARKCVK